MRRHLPDARLVIIPDAAHEVMVDQQDAFNRVVSAFLQAGTPAIEDQFAAR